MRVFSQLVIVHFNESFSGFLNGVKLQKCHFPVLCSGNHPNILRCEINSPFVKMNRTYGKNLNAFTAYPFSLNASVISSSPTELGILLKWSVALGG